MAAPRRVRAKALQRKAYHETFGTDAGRLVLADLRREYEARHLVYCSPTTGRVFVALDHPVLSSESPEFQRGLCVGRLLAYQHIQALVRMTDEQFQRAEEHAARISQGASDDDDTE